METSEISLHQLKIYQAAKQHAQWMTVQDLVAATGCARRTVANHVLRFVSIGVFEQAEVFPAHRYRFSPMAEKRDKAFAQRMARAAEVFGHE